MDRSLKTDLDCMLLVYESLSSLSYVYYCKGLLEMSFVVKSKFEGYRTQYCCKEAKGLEVVVVVIVVVSCQVYILSNQSEVSVIYSYY